MAAGPRLKLRSRVMKGGKEQGGGVGVSMGNVKENEGGRQLVKTGAIGSNKKSGLSMEWLRTFVCFVPNTTAKGEGGREHAGCGDGNTARSRASGTKVVDCVEPKLENSQELDAEVLEKDRVEGSERECVREKDDGAGNFEQCGLCHASEASETFVASCRHQFCRSCIEDHFSETLKDQMHLSNPTLESVAACSRCPNSSCAEELSRKELVELLGDNIVRSYERWLVLFYGGIFGPLTGSGQQSNPHALCWNAECDQKNPTAFLSTQLNDPSIQEVGPEKDGSKVFWLCTTCPATWCVFCGKHVQDVNTNSDQNKVHMKCDGRQNFMLYKCMVDLEGACNTYTKGRQVTPVQKTSPKRNTKTIWASGTGYGGDYIDIKKEAESMQVAAKRKELELDSKIATALNYLTHILNVKRGHREGRAGFSFPTGFCVLLGWGNTLSRLLRHLATNDSMLDISERSNLYFKMVGLLRAVKLHPELDFILSGYQSGNNGEREGWVGSRAVLQTVTSSSKGEGEELNEGNNNIVMKKMENIYKQAKVMVQRIQTSGTADVEAQVDISLAKELCACYESLQENETTEIHSTLELAPSTTLGIASRLIQKLAGQGEEIRIKKHEIYKEKLKALQFQEVEMVDENGQYRHHFRDQIAGKSSQSASIDKRGVHNQKRMLHMAKEVSSLSTTLPLEWESGIHLCVDQHRMDVLRALIIGPNGTPYQNGIFLFDIFLPPDYPQVPPSVHFLTTGGGKVRFNPNLYYNGKICLSLLGTWGGPGWLPGKSTLLQVLVSIQSLIFVQDPYYNEPGHEKKKSPEAEKENLRHREHTLSLAVLAPLQKPDPMFADLITQHFRYKREEVERQCNEWLSLATDNLVKQRMNNIVKEIKMELNALRS